MLRFDFASNWGGIRAAGGGGVLVGGIEGVGGRIRGGSRVLNLGVWCLHRSIFFFGSRVCAIGFTCSATED
jgi:hypothetical protein